MSYGYCPICKAAGISRERGINGNDRCQNGHTYPSADSMFRPDILERLKALRGEGWQPIVTAPKDGSSILGYSKFGGAWEKNGGYCVVVKWKEREFPDGTGGWVNCHAGDCEDEQYTFCGIIFWMPLPTQPK